MNIIFYSKLWSGTSNSAWTMSYVWRTSHEISALSACLPRLSRLRFLDMMFYGAKKLSSLVIILWYEICKSTMSTIYHSSYLNWERIMFDMWHTIVSLLNMLKRIVHIIVATRWTLSGEWMLDTILSIF